MSAPVDVLAAIGELAVASVQARRARIAAKNARQQAVRMWHEEFGEDRYDDEGDLHSEFVEATYPTQTAYKAAVKFDSACRGRLVRAVKRLEKENPAVARIGGAQ